uniref:carbonic anhydrase n=1 Tax=Grammatophora oceanica TaxID=210454 RepID=A0A7S1UQX8_9STRA|eukprot:CAMPEP_0194047792 /NCGR_PEP_ID=MMETSP0009_2-20130614/25535_1 /TAXON_ID=210454 /ORGANISM="Grammatophora oceanica, Strain CCMP 410" /LENGTH=525 /DNA_ID=CAMNT_0038693507 /DNA_START=27 /DNA_END=1604 /DNA_ORIENTATION=-
MKVLVVLTAATAVYAANDDRFNYRNSDGNNYGPEDWGRVSCSDKNVCLGWPDAWETARGWNLGGTSCKWCPANTNKRCGNGHHQSPIDLLRNKAINGSSTFNECIDVHWMKYEDSSCSWQQLAEENAFTIEPHALKITQPLERVADNSIRLRCPQDGGRKWGRIDFSKGFSQWWLLSHIDFKVPSEHSQEGKFYSGEIQMAHFYSVQGNEAGSPDNEMAHVSMFIQEYDNVPPYPWLERAICQWRQTEEDNRKGCGLASVPPYPGCFPYTRGRNDTVPPGARNLRRREHRKSVLQEMEEMIDLDQPFNIEIDPENLGEHPMSDEEWEEWITDYSEKDKKRFEEWENGDHREPWEKGDHRELLELDHEPFHNYQALIDCKTEYYFRYSGTQTAPPCWGRFEQAQGTSQNRGFTSHWRVMKDPIPVHPRQITEMHRLLRERINPPPYDGQIRTPCSAETAAAVDSNTGRVNVARPLQYTTSNHFKVFCECQDWRSKWPEDRAWCKSGSQMHRLYDNPYNHAYGGGEW